MTDTNICLPHGLPVDREGNERKRYVKVVLDGSYCIMSPTEADQYKREATRWEPDTRYVYEDVMMSDAEFEALPEFGGF
jgi:hypothetical protein